jgi:hypothetical protein
MNAASSPKSTGMIQPSFNDNASTASSECEESDFKSNHVHSDESANNRHKPASVTYNERDEVEKLIEHENNEVRRWRIIVLLMLVSTASLVTFFSYKFLQKEDRRDFDIGVSEHTISLLF